MISHPAAPAGAGSGGPGPDRGDRAGRVVLFDRTLLTLGVLRDRATNQRVLAARLFDELDGFTT